jgi:hypothetical protein
MHRAVALDVVVGDPDAPPLPPASFDLVFNSGVVEHLSRELRRDAVRAMATIGQARRSRRDRRAQRKPSHSIPSGPGSSIHTRPTMRSSISPSSR